METVPVLYSTCMATHFQPLIGQEQQERCSDGCWQLRLAAGSQLLLAAQW